METRIRAKPHPAQKVVHDHPARFKVLSAGRRFGKTRLGVLECIDVASHGGIAWWVAPTYKIALVGWKPLVRLSRKIPGAQIKLGDMEVSLQGGGVVAIRSADSPGGLRGEGLNLVVLDECAFMREEAWTEELRPALSDKLGHALFISTPKGLNWFWNLYQRGQDPEQTDWQSWKFPTASNPYIAASEIEAARQDLPELVFQQEYLAEFISLEGAVFRRIQEAAVVQPIEQPLPGHTYTAGVDVASSVDFTVACVLDNTTRELVYIDRYNRVDYPVLEDRLHGLYRRFKLSSMTIEANSIGQGVIDHLVSRGMSVIPFMTTNATKQTAITGLQAAFEHGEIKIPNDPVLIGELLSFESKRNPSGSFTYSAPEGLHDDCVMALAIGWQAINEWFYS